MTTTTPHVHAPSEAQPSVGATLGIEWCACGKERRTGRRDATWNKPRMTEGLLRAAQWRGE